MAISKSALIASVSRPSAPTIAAALDADTTSKKSLAPAPFYTREDRPPTHPDIPKSNNELKAWMRQQLVTVTSRAVPKLDATMADYHRKYLEMDTHRDSTGCIPASALGKTKATFYAKRAALVAVAAVRGRAALSEISRANSAYTNAKKIGNLKLADQERSAEEKGYQNLIMAGNDLVMYPQKSGGIANTQKINEFKSGVKIYDDNPALQGLVYEKPAPTPPGSWQAALENGDVERSTKPKTSKSKDMARIQKVHPNWRDKGFEQISERWKTYYAIASITGCRPEEIAGIRIMQDPTDPTFLRIGIRGAKVSQGHGIEQRIFSIREKDSLSFDHLMKIAARGPVAVTLPTMKSGKVITKVKDAFRNACNEAGRGFIHQRTGCPTLSPYCLRHSFASDIKADKMDGISVAVLMGHSTTRTQRGYGNSANGIKGQREIKVDTKGYHIKEVVSAPFMQPDIAKSPTTTPTSDQEWGGASIAP
jgi:integrase